MTSSLQNFKDVDEGFCFWDVRQFIFFCKLGIWSENEARLFQFNVCLNYFVYESCLSIHYIFGI